jgi:antigen flippase
LSNPIKNHAAVAPTEAAGQSSYGRILKSSSVIGGSQVISYAIGLFRTKAVALLLGPAGVGFIGLYNSIIEVSKTVSGMGLRSSGVREIASAIGQNDDELVGQLQLAIRRLAVCLGVVIACLLGLASPLVSTLVFGNPAKSSAFAILAVILVFNGINVAQTATIQGYRQVGDLARMSILGAVFSTLIAVGLYAVFGEAGIVPALVAMSAIAVLVAWRYSRRFWVIPEHRDWSTSRMHWKRLVGLGSAVAWGALLGALVPFFARSLVVRELGIEANGIYMAAWAISGLFAQFIITAMSADFFPSLSAVSHDDAKMNRLVNEQIEVGVLIALVGLLTASVFAPLAIRVLYTPEFLPSAILLQWFLLGIFGRVVSWPMGMLVLAKGHSKTFAVLQSISVPIHIGWILLCFHYFGLEGAAMAFALQNIIYVPALLMFLRKQYALCWTNEVGRLLLSSLGALCMIQVLRLFLNESTTFYLCSIVILIVAGWFSLRGLLLRVGDNPKIRRMLSRLPKPLLRVVS